MKDINIQPYRTKGRVLDDLAKGKRRRWQKTLAPKQEGVGYENERHSDGKSEEQPCTLILRSHLSRIKRDNNS